MALADNYEPTKDLGDASTVVYTAVWDPISTDYAECYFEDVTTEVQTLQSGVTFERLANNTLKATLPAAATSGYYVILSRDVPNEQAQSYTTSSGFPAKTVEGTFDKIVGMVQELVETIGRSLSYPLGTSASVSQTMPVPEDGKPMVGNSAGTGWELSDTDINDLDTAIASTEASASAAASSASAASGSASSASGYATAASGYSDDASDYADDAAASAASIGLSAPDPIGDTTPNTGAFTTLSSTGQSSLNTLEIGGSGAVVTTIENNDSLGTSDTKLCTQGNVKQYVDIAVASTTYAAGTVLISSADTENTNNATTTYVKRKEIKIPYGGALRIEFDINDGGTAAGRAQIWRNGSPVGTNQTATASYVTKSEDISGWSAQDTVELWVKNSVGTSAINTKYFRVYSTVVDSITVTLDG